MVSVIFKHQMAINKKNTRPITCNGRKFWWKVSPHNKLVKFIAGDAENSGRMIEVLIESDINRFWVEFPDVSDLDLKVITPKDAASFILQALADGWHPEEKGNILKYQLLADKLIRKRGD